jgi:hypothetical protein
MIRIGRELGNLNGATLHHLPEDYTTLYQIARLGEARVLAGIEKGQIRACLTHAQATALVRAILGCRKRATKGALLRRTVSYTDFALENLNDLSCEELTHVQDKLDNLLQQIRAQLSPK